LGGYEEGGHGREASAVLDGELVRTSRAVGAHVGAVYIDVPEELVVRMAVIMGVPGQLTRAWSRAALASRVPVAQAVRTRQPVWIDSQQEMANRFPRTALAFPYPVAMYVAPLVLDGLCWGAFLLLWPSSGAQEPSGSEEHEIVIACRHMAGALRRAAEAGEPLRPEGEPRTLPPPLPQRRDPGAEIIERLSGGFCGIDPEGRVTFVDSAACDLLGCDAEGLLGRRIWEALPWLGNPTAGNAYLFALFSRLPARFTARAPDGRWLSFAVYAGDTGVTVRIDSGEAAPTEEEDEPSDPSLGSGPARASALFHLLHLASALTEATGVQEVADSLIKQMMPVLDAQGLLLLIADEGRIGVVASHGFPPEVIEYMRGLPLSASTEGMQTLETGVARFHSDGTKLRRAFPEVMRHAHMNAYAFLPLTVSGRTIGTCVFGYDRRRLFPSEERAELTSLAWMIAQALDRARLHEASIRAARDLQVGLLPRILPVVHGLEAAARYRAATHTLDVGGDFYDLIRIDETSVAAVIGDVQGHSASAAALMGQIRTAVHTHAQAGATPDQVLFRANRLLTDFDSELFASCLYAHIDLRRRCISLATAGHPPPILNLPGEGSRIVDLPQGLLLGIDPDAEYVSTQVLLPAEGLLALYTDGLVERPGVDIELSVKELADHIAQTSTSSLGAFCDDLLARAESTVTEKNADDIAILVLRLLAGTDAVVSAGSPR
jgi:PAS domain-containing protein